MSDTFRDLLLYKDILSAAFSGEAQKIKDSRKLARSARPLVEAGLIVRRARYEVVEGQEDRARELVALAHSAEGFMNQLRESVQALLVMERVESE